MSSIHIPRVLSTRGKTSADLDRENFERSQVCIDCELFNVLVFIGVRPAYYYQNRPNYKLKRCLPLARLHLCSLIVQISYTTL